jgi:NAD(P)-dependent dehydrogenase (short-subunit alcohol dehydrogenase family)
MRGANQPTAMVTGASKGIGRAVADLLASRGWRVALCARSTAELEKAAGHIQKSTGSQALAVTLDFSVPADIERGVATIMGEWGRIDGLVNNAGASAFGPFEDLPYEAWDEGFRLKLFGYVHTARAVLPHMRAGGGGTIVNIAGNAGKQIVTNHMIGGAANVAIVHFTKALSIEAGRDGVRVNAVSPGATTTERIERLIASLAERAGITVAQQLARMSEEIPLGRLGAPREIAEVVEFLLSDRSSYVSGQNILVDGGAVRSI